MPLDGGRIFTTGLTRMGSHIFGFFGARQFFTFTASKSTRLFIMLYKVVLTFESVDEILKCDHSNESY